MPHWAQGGYCCSTSRPRTSTTATACWWSGPSPSWPDPASPWSWRPMLPTRRCCWAGRWRCCGTERSSPTAPRRRNWRPATSSAPMTWTSRSPAPTCPGSAARW